jgi:signal transduction histidine kinase
LKATNPVTKVLTKGTIQGLANHTILIAKSGKEIAIDDSAAPILSSTGNLIGVVLIFRDISERRSLELQKDDFISITSHELKTPLTSIKLNSQVLQKKLQKANNIETDAILTQINQQVNKMTDIINTFLDLSRIETKRLNLDLTKFNLRQLLEDIITTLTKTDTSKHKIFLDYNFKGLITADKNRLEQVITNLLVNSIKYSPNANTINVKVNSTKNYLTLSVEDHGIGIAPEKIDLIFDRFYRANPDYNNGNSGSLGLGLYIAKNIIAQHRGKIRVKSTLGFGSTFYISLPLKQKSN